MVEQRKIKKTPVEFNASTLVCMIVDQERETKLKSPATVFHFYIFSRLPIRKSVYADPGCLSRIRIFSISRIRKKWKYFNPNIVSSSRKYDPGCSCWIRIPETDPDFYPSQIPDPGDKRHRIPDPDPQH
jgi:hypothetical protein